jgi:hypothetical protein
MARRKNLTRDERKRQILIAFAVEIQQGNAPEMTIADIARKLHLAPSTKLRDIVMELVVDGSLDFRNEEIPGVAKFRRIYSPNYKAFRPPKAEYGRQGRAIKVNTKQGSFLAEIGE